MTERKDWGDGGHKDKFRQGWEPRKPHPKRSDIFDKPNPDEKCDKRPGVAEKS